MIKLPYKKLLIFFLFSIPATLLNLTIMFIINKCLTGKLSEMYSYLWLTYILIIVTAFALSILYEKKITSYANDLVFRLELKIFEDILKTDFKSLQKLGVERVYGTIEDLRFFSVLPNVATSTVNSVLMVLICLMYLTATSIEAALLMLFLLGSIVVCCILLVKRRSKKANNLRLLNDYYFKLVDDLLKGFRELKISNTRRKNLFAKFLLPNRKKAKHLESAMAKNVMIVQLISKYGMFILVGAVIFLLPGIGLLTKSQVSPFVVLILFLNGPISNLVHLQPFYSRLIISGRRINIFFEDLEYKTKAVLDKKAEDGEIEFNELAFKNLRYKYDSALGNGFEIGPIDLSIHSGETIFIVGGNGSGKSTFINILTGLYTPLAGEILLNGKTIQNTDLMYLKQISAIFSDNHLFGNNYDGYELQHNETLNVLLRRMELEDIVVMDEFRNSRRNYSKGQSKRLAMIFAILENHPIIVLDEWAADQDPYFREYFYKDIIPFLKSKGKTIIAVTHDDAYFKHADRIVKFYLGQIEEVDLK